MTPSARTNSHHLSSATVNQRAGEEGQPPVIATMLSKDHKPEDPVETKRVESLGMEHTQTIE